MLSDSKEDSCSYSGSIIILLFSILCYMVNFLNTPLPPSGTLKLLLYFKW